MTGRGATGPAASFQAASAGRIRLAGPGVAPWLAATASAASMASVSGVVAALAQTLTGRAMPRMSEASGAS